MGNTCGCVDPAEKDGEVNVENNKHMQKNQHRQSQLNNYRDSTLSNNYDGKNAGGGNMMQAKGGTEGMPHIFDTQDPYLIDLQHNAIA